MKYERWQIDANRKMTQKLGGYLFVIASLQIVFYFGWVVAGGPEWIYLLDPRVGPLLFESTIIDVGSRTPGVLCWIFAIALLGIATVMLVTGRGLKLYLVAESLFSVPTIFVFAWIVMASFGSPQGFPLILVIPPIAVFLVFSVLPYGLAVRILAGSPADLSIMPHRVSAKSSDPAAELNLQ